MELTQIVFSVPANTSKLRLLWAPRGLLEEVFGDE